MNETDMKVLVQELQRSTQLGRLNHDEAHAVFDRLKALGHSVTASKGLVAGEPEGVHPNYTA
ncbi:hypothetical protein CO678_27095 [Bradyrhizobium diazoefficiens]|uniref:hypothetical protein n=1 Tax=Bradyrhizobium diazoefficiens TaxID=1355477 RepID=UPI000BE8EE9E|nr:hypothetical protein [Bradyrhizobium diazoefficiens]PDT58880.1 hypothetical protein CO678_27095 [Bradyrhizobium diazoefficiens]